MISHILLPEFFPPRSGAVFVTCASAAVFPVLRPCIAALFPPARLPCTRSLPECLPDIPLPSALPAVFQAFRCSENHHRRLMRRKAADGLFIRTGVLPAILVITTDWEISGSVYSACSAAAAPQKKELTPGHTSYGNLTLFQSIHLLSYRSVQTRIPGMQPNDPFSFFFPCIHHFQNFFQRHIGAVIYFTAFFFLPAKDPDLPVTLHK